MRGGQALEGPGQGRVLVVDGGRPVSCALQDDEMATLNPKIMHAGQALEGPGQGRVLVVDGGGSLPRLPADKFALTEYPKP